MLMPFLGIVGCTVIILAMIFPTTYIIAKEDVKWKTFKEKNGLFTMNYPSNWLPGKSPDDSENPSLINMNFVYSGGGRSDVASVSVIADESIYTNVSDLMDTLTAALTSKFKIVQPVECTKFVIKGTESCSIVTTYKETKLPGKPTVMEMDVVTIDRYGVQYTLIYGASKNLYDDFLPVAEEMIKSFNSGNILSPGDESASGIQDSSNVPQQVTWKIFEEKNGLFTIKYPSNWSPYKAYEDSSSPFNIYFTYSGGSSSFAELLLYGEESIYTNATDVVNSYSVTPQNEQNYRVLQPIQCGKYTIKSISACDTIISFKDTAMEGKPIIRSLIIGAIDEGGMEYILQYYVTMDLYDHFLPVAEEMVNSFNVTNSIPSSGGESTQSTSDSPELPPLEQAPTVKKL
jgi:hypothetical protein